MPRKSDNAVAEVPEAAVIAKADLEALEIDDIDAEIAEMTKGFQLQPPRIRIEHSTSGRHRMFIDSGESYTDDTPGQIDLPGNVLTGIVCFAQTIRAMWSENEPMPQCAAVDNKPTVTEPIHPSCTGCPESVIGNGKCKPKVRLLVLAFVNGKPTLVVFPLSPTSIKRWRAHVSKLARSKAPYTAVVTKFTLDDIQKNSFRWAEVCMSVDRVVTKDEMKAALSIRDQFDQQLKDVDDADYDDPGDKLPF
ncbi:hypothetical protein KKG05_09770 [bacterium]|nr:hypothetical protein [bacterium]